MSPFKSDDEIFGLFFPLCIQVHSPGGQIISTLYSANSRLAQSDDSSESGEELESELDSELEDSSILFDCLTPCPFDCAFVFLPEVVLLESDSEVEEEEADDDEEESSSEEEDSDSSSSSLEEEESLSEEEDADSESSFTFGFGDGLGAASVLAFFACYGLIHKQPRQKARKRESKSIFLIAYRRGYCSHRGRLRGRVRRRGLIR